MHLHIGLSRGLAAVTVMLSCECSTDSQLALKLGVACAGHMMPMHDSQCCCPSMGCSRKKQQ